MSPWWCRSKQHGLLALQVFGVHADYALAITQKQLACCTYARECTSVTGTAKYLSGGGSVQVGLQEARELIDWQL